MAKKITSIASVNLSINEAVEEEDDGGSCWGTVRRIADERG
jgi:hypothetical protein